MHVLFLPPSPLVLPSHARARRVCARASPCMARKRSSRSKSSKSKSPTPPPSSSSSSSSSSTPTPMSSPKPPPPSSEPYVPRGPTMRAEYEQKGIIEPSLSPDAGILPEVVSNRMIRRIAIFAGIPISFLISFFVIYFLLKYKYDITVLPVVVAYSTLGTIGLATGGITYGIFSCSWDEEPGSLLGWEEARINLLRAKDGLLGAREREKREDEFDRIDRLVDEQDRKANKNDNSNPPPSDDASPPTV